MEVLGLVVVVVVVSEGRSVEVEWCKKRGRMKRNMVFFPLSLSLSLNQEAKRIQRAATKMLAELRELTHEDRLKEMGLTTL